MNMCKPSPSYMFLQTHSHMYFIRCSKVSGK